MQIPWRDRNRQRDEHNTLNPETDYHRIYRDNCLLEFGTDTKLGLHLAFYRSFTIPSIARLLDRTGEIERHPEKRSADTGLLMYELIAAGFHDPRGVAVVRQLNRMHRRWDITNDEYLYILTTFIVSPARWINRNGRRQLTDVEMQAATAFYRELGRRMRIPDLPATYRDADAYLRSYEAQHMAPSAEAARLMRAAQHVFANTLPKPIRRFSDPLVTVLLGEPAVAAALGLPEPSRTLRTVVKAGLLARKLVGRVKKPAEISWFRPGEHSAGYYRGSYDLDQLGPDGRPISSPAGGQ